MSLPEDKPISLREALERKLNSTGLRCSAPRNAVDKVKLHLPPRKSQPNRLCLPSYRHVKPLRPCHTCREIVEAGPCGPCAWVDRWITVFPIQPASLFKTACVRHTQKANSWPRVGPNWLVWAGPTFCSFLCSLLRFLFPLLLPQADAIGIFSTSAVLSRGIYFCPVLYTQKAEGI